MKAVNRKLSRERARSGLQLLEFGAALCIFVSLLVLPVVAAVTIGMRWVLAQTASDQLVAKLARCERLSEAYGAMRKNNDAKHQLTLVISSYGSDKSVEVDHPRAIPRDWLPADAARNYTLHLRSTVEVAVLGLALPVSIGVHSSATWENLGRDPLTKQFYINE